MDAHFRVFLVTERGEGLEPPENRFAADRICHSANLASYYCSYPAFWVVLAFATVGAYAYFVLHLRTPEFESELPAYYGI